MCFFKKKSIADKVENDRELIAYNSTAIEAAIVLAKDDESVINSLKELQEKLKYLKPSENSQVIRNDKEITKLINDLRVALSQQNAEVNKKTEEFIKSIKLAIVDRNARL